jgi:hypothetical protein
MGWDLIKDVWMGLKLSHVVIVQIQSWIKDRFPKALLWCEVIWESLLQVHDEASKFIEEFALQGFDEEIANHLFHGTILNREFIVVDAVGDEI